MLRSNDIIIKNDPATGDVLTPDIPCHKVSFRSMPDNTGHVHVSIGGTARAGNCWPLDIGDGRDDIYVSNVNELDVFFEVAGEKLALIYEVEK